MASNRAGWPSSKFFVLGRTSKYLSSSARMCSSVLETPTPGSSFAIHIREFTFGVKAFLFFNECVDMSQYRLIGAFLCHGSPSASRSLLFERKH